jgi:hypothetical protein
VVVLDVDEILGAELSATGELELTTLDEVVLVRRDKLVEERSADVELWLAVVDVEVCDDGVTELARSVLKVSGSVFGTAITGAQLPSAVPPTLTDMTLSAPTQKPAPGKTRAPPEIDHTIVVGMADTDE